MTIVQSISTLNPIRTISGLSKINIILGRNGCGKSTILRAISKSDLSKSFTKKIYISPERAGSLKFQSGIDHQVRTESRYLENEREKNQSPNFKMQTVSNFSLLQQWVLNKYHDTNGNAEYRMEPVVESLNSLLENIEFVRSSNDFKFKSRHDGSVITPENISSGESELTAIGIEILNFCYPLEGSNGLILIDEPDVHIHPDLQVKLMNFIIKQVAKFNIQVIIATHSTAFLASISLQKDSTVCFMKSGDNNLSFLPVNLSTRKLLPAFGAHPLTQVFNQDAPLIVEGEDDERIWIQAIRSSCNQIKLFPVVAEDKGQLSEMEKEARTILPTIFENARCFSLRDGDGLEGDLDDEGVVRRFRLNCYAAENLLLTDDVLRNFGLNWTRFKESVDDWLQKNPTHTKYAAVLSFKDAGYDRKSHKLKDVQHIFASFFESQSPWEVKIGQTIAKGVVSGEFPDSDFSLKCALGERLLRDLLGIKT